MDGEHLEEPAPPTSCPADSHLDSGRRGAARFIYYEDQGNWRAADYYALFRYLNRLFLNDKGRRSAEIASLDLARMRTTTKHLLKHILLLKQAYARVLAEFPNLSGLEQTRELDVALYLSDHPTFAYPYFTEHGIYL